MNEDEIKLTNGVKLAFDWSKITDEYKKLMPSIDINQIITTDSCCGISYSAYKSSYDRNCSASNDSAEVEEIKHRLEKLEDANGIMRTDCKAMAEGFVIRENKIKELEAENNKLKEKIEELVEAIEYCKKNGIWADKPVMMPLFNAVCSCLVKSDDEYDVAEHLLDGLEIDDEDKD